ncbi:unnamed protein product [Adineta steineri]|uniref:Uncharacterized protein n=1 Tax=Adineta steineri TaxID=433720 RepID=A0A813ZTB6_9BILA|nr:unnamed protein product [Adineta steineri]
MRIVDIELPLNPKMKQGHLKLLLCLLLAASATGQWNTAGQQGGPQPLGFGQSSMSAWGGFSGMGAFAPSLGSALTAAAAAPPADTKFAGADVTSGTVQQYGSSAAVPAAGDSRSLSTNVCYSIIDSTFPSFSDYCSALPQTTFTLPNFFGHNTKREANDLLLSLAPALDAQCVHIIRMFTCPLFFPPCNDAATLPCASLCRKIQNQCNGFDLSAINCDQLPEQSDFCPSFTGSTRALGGGGAYGSSGSYNSYGGSSYGQAAKSVGPAPYSGGDSYGASSYGHAAKSVGPAPYGGSSSGEAVRSVGSGSYGGSSYGGAAKSVGPAPYGGSSSGEAVRSVGSGSYGGSSYGQGVKSVGPAPYSGGDSYGASSYGHAAKSFGPAPYGGSSSGEAVRSVGSGSYGGSSYGGAAKSVGPASYGGSSSGEAVRSVGSGSYGGSSYGGAVKSVGPAPYGGGDSYGGSSNGDVVKSTGSVYGSAINFDGPAPYGGSSSGEAVRSVGSGSYGGSSYGQGVKSVGPAPYGGSSSGEAVRSVGSGSYGGSSYGQGVKSVGSASYGGSSYGEAAKSVGPAPYGGGDSYGGLPHGPATKSFGPKSYGNGGIYGGSSHGEAAKSVGSGSYGGSSYGQAAKSVAPASYGGSSYGSVAKSAGSSSYGNGGSYGASYDAASTGAPYGIQSTGEYTAYYPEQLDLSNCGPTPTQNPCTLDGPQYFPLPGYPQCYIQCALDIMYVKPCPHVLVWNPRINVCDWPTVAEYPAYDNNYGSSSYGAASTNYESGPSNSYGRKKRSTSERKKRFFPGGFGGGRPISMEVPVGPPLPGLIPLPGLPGPIGVPGPLIPPPFFPPFGPPFGPIPPPFIPPFLPPIGPIPPPILPPPLIPPFLPPFVPPMPVPLGGPLLPPLPMSIPATFIPGPPPIFGNPLFGPFGGPGGPLGGPFGGLGGPLGGPFGGLGGPFGGPLGGFGGPLEPFGGPFGPFDGPFGGFGGEEFFDDPFDSDFGFGGGFPFGDEFYGGPPGPFFEPFPFPGGYDIGFGDGDYGMKGHHGKGGYGKSHKSKGGYGNSNKKNNYGNSYKSNNYDNSYKSNNYDNGYKSNNYDSGYKSNNYDNNYKSNNYDNGYKSNNYDSGYKSNNYDNSYKSNNYDNGYKSNNYDSGYKSNNYDNDYKKNSYDNGYKKNSYDNGYKKNSYDSGNKKNSYDNSYSSYNDDDDNSYSKSDYSKNGGFSYPSYKSKGSKSYSSSNSGYGNNDYAGNYYRKKRQYGLNVEQETERHLPQQLAVEYSPMTSVQQKVRLPTESLIQPSICAGKSIKTNVPHPTDLKKYISCLNENSYKVMDCPSGLIFNVDINQCEKTTNSESLCERDQPCMNDGQCYQTSPSSYKCTCRGSWTGERCETPLSSCASNPCGENSECHTLVANDFKQDYVCVCDNKKSYGLTCGRNTVPNPCIAEPEDREQYYPFAYSAHAYVQCNGDLFYVRPCAGGLFWNQETKICDRAEVAPARPFHEQSESYKNTYGSPQSKLMFTRPLVSAADQSVDTQQGYRYRNYNPHKMVNDQGTFNQMNSRKEMPMNSFFSVPLVMKQNRRLLAQPQYTTREEQPTESDQETNTFVQPTPQRPTFRFFHSSPSRMVNSMNTQSSYKK